MAGYRVISSDSHIFEPPDLWTERIGPKFKDRAPHVVSMDDGDWWYCDGRRVTSMDFGAKTGIRFEEPEKLSATSRVESVRLGGLIPEEHVKDMDVDGVDAGVIFPSNAFKLYNTVQDSVLLTACFRVYNDWITEFCQTYPDRLYGIAMLNVDDVREGIAEMERCSKMGLVGAMIPVYPHDGTRYNSPVYESLWRAAQDLRMPVHLHILTNRLRVGDEFGDHHGGKLAAGGDDSPAFLAAHDYWARMSLGDMIFSGVFERYPELQVGAVEFELAWIPHFLRQIDYVYTQRILGPDTYRFNSDILPSDFFHSNVFVGFLEDGLGIRMRDIIGVDNMMWGSDYPHPESTFPRSKAVLEDILRDCTEDEKAKIAGGNAARVYRIG